MSYLDVNPMIVSLRTSPDHFAFTSGALHHIPSGHRFKFDPSGKVRIDAPCACSQLEVDRRDEQPLFQAYGDWRRDYWRPLQINRQFAAHFKLPLWRRVLIAITGRLHQALLSHGNKKHELEIASIAAE